MGTWTCDYDTLNRLIATHDTAITPESTQFNSAWGCWTYDGLGNSFAGGIISS